MFCEPVIDQFGDSGDVIVQVADSLSVAGVGTS